MKITEVKEKNAEIKAKDVGHKAELKAKDLEIKKIKEVVPTVAVPIKRGRSYTANNESIGIDDAALALKVSKLVVQGLEKKVATVAVVEAEFSAAEYESKFCKEQMEHAFTKKELDITTKNADEKRLLEIDKATFQANALSEVEHKKELMLREETHRSAFQKNFDRVLDVLEKFAVPSNK